MKKNNSDKNKIKPPPELLDKIMQKLKGIDTPAKEQKEMVRFLVKYFVMPDYADLYDTNFDDNFTQIYDHLKKLRQGYRIAAGTNLAAATGSVAGIETPLTLKNIIKVSDAFITKLIQKGEVSSTILNQIGNELVERNANKELVAILKEALTKLFLAR